MANPEHFAILLKGVNEWNEWRQKKSDVTPDLSRLNLQRSEFSGADLGGANLDRTVLFGADLSEANLTRANLERADLGGGANLSGAKLTRANFFKADLGEAILSRADLSRANLTGAYLVKANLGGADLRWTNLTLTDLNSADLSYSLFGLTVLGSVDLSETKGLDQVHHDGPSTIGIDTIYKSKGQIPEQFLRGAGVPDSFIVFAKSLVTNPIEFYSCFISYSTKDQDFADRLYADLQAKGVRCWFARHDAQSGRKLHEQIDEAIRHHEKVLLILSPNSMNSEWVKTEIAKARQREVREKAQILFPISLVPYEAIRDWECFDADAGKDSAREIREYLIADFTQWKNHDSYSIKLEKLIRDLQSKRKSPPAS